MTTTESPAVVREHLLAVARALASTFAGASDEIDEARRLPPHIVQAMKDARLFAMAMPREWGGWEAEPATQVAVIEELAAANGSVGWCLMIGVSGGFLSAFIEPGEARAMWPDANMVAANAFVPMGTAVRVEGGYRVTGRWPFASGIHHADWLSGPALVVDEQGERLKDEVGRPIARIFFAPQPEVEIIDTWHTTGLKGTGSCDFAYNDLFVPEVRAVDHVNGPVYREGPLYGSFVVALLNHLGIPLGIGRAAVQAFTAGIRGKEGKFGFAPKDDVAVHLALAEATALVAASRAYAYSTIDRVWQERLQTGDSGHESRVDWRLANVFVHDACARAVELLHRASGSMAVYTPNPIDRAWRDINTAREHGVMAPRTYAQAGKAILTGETPSGW